MSNVNYLDFETFNNGVIVFNDGRGMLKDCTDKLNNDTENWELVKVIIKREMIDDLTELTKYEYRYRLYLSTVYKLLGYDDSVADRYRSYYWEKDLNGNFTDYYLP